MCHLFDSVGDRQIKEISVYNQRCLVFSEVIIIILLTATLAVDFNASIVFAMQYTTQPKFIFRDLISAPTIFEFSPYDQGIYDVVNSTVEMGLDNHGGAAETVQSSDPRDSAVITMQRHGALNCMSPVYSLTIFGNGNVVYEGIKNVNTTGILTYQIPKDGVRELVNEFINIYYFALKDKYTDSSNASCLGMVTTSINMNGRTKTVLDDKSSYAPAQLRELEDKIDNVTNSRQWIER
jgi:hypothetical protein